MNKQIAGAKKPLYISKSKINKVDLNDYKRFIKGLNAAENNERVEKTVCSLNTDVNSSSEKLVTMVKMCEMSSNKLFIKYYSFLILVML